MCTISTTWLGIFSKYVTNNNSQPYSEMNCRQVMDMRVNMCNWVLFRIFLQFTMLHERSTQTRQLWCKLHLKIPSHKLPTFPRLSRTKGSTLWYSTTLARQHAIISDQDLFCLQFSKQWEHFHKLLVFSFLWANKIGSPTRIECHTSKWRK